jgi:hypothetical protein
MRLRRISDPHDGLAAGLKGARQRRHTGSVLQALRHVPALIIVEADGPPQRFAFGFGPVEASLSALDQEVAFELGHGVDDMHGQLTGRAGEIDTAQSEAMHPHSDAGKFGDGAADIHGIAAEAVKFCDDEDVAGFEPVEQAGEAPALRRGDAARDRFGHHPARFDLEAGGLDLRIWLSVVWLMVETRT